MILILSKIVYFLITPLTWLILAILTWAFAKKKKIKQISKVSAIVIILFFSNTFIYKEALRLWEIPAINKSEIQKHDVGIVLGGMFEYDNDADRLSIRRGGDRIWQAIDLYKANKIKKICIVGKHGNIIDKGLDEAVQLKTQLVEWGIPAIDILIETESRNTNENAKFTAALFKQSYPHFNSFLLITSARHMKRAEASFEKVEMNVTPFSTDQYVGKERYYTWDEFIIPSSDTFNGWFGLIKEVVGYVGYGLFS
ncbi:YdcF family protein [Brumimicrobium glaciale]|uniref:YdcF family protein n=1 Tax=Brumimicrobium glaciale TaxID=200475 RepID=A0A4Q4KMP3_9FLAO|nr:YdcF family protein [Brumimicrobium glaciale]RYM34671.1 YdcF family protein [Brumimicrobium glaciale]